VWCTITCHAVPPHDKCLGGCIMHLRCHLLGQGPAASLAVDSSKFASCAESDSCYHRPSDGVSSSLLKPVGRPYVAFSCRPRSVAAFPFARLHLSSTSRALIAPRLPWELARQSVGSVAQSPLKIVLATGLHCKPFTRPWQGTPLEGSPQQSFRSSVPCTADQSLWMHTWHHHGIDVA